MWNNDNLQPPFLGPGTPGYPALAQAIGITGAALDQNVYPGVLVQQDGGNLALRPRVPCFIWEPNRILLRPGFYMHGRLDGTYQGLPLVIVSQNCCQRGGSSSASASASASVSPGFLALLLPSSSSLSQVVSGLPLSPSPLSSLASLRPSSPQPSPPISPSPGPSPPVSPSPARSPSPVPSPAPSSPQALSSGVSAAASPAASSSLSLSINACCQGYYIATTLHVTFHDTGGCACLDGLTFALTPQPAPPQEEWIWVPPPSGICTNLMQIKLTCFTNTAHNCIDWQLSVICGADGGGSAQGNAGCTCVPLDLEFDVPLMLDSTGQGCCTGTVHATVTL